jgi:ADP-ribose pyrophosphatase
MTALDQAQQRGEVILVTDAADIEKAIAFRRKRTGDESAESEMLGVVFSDEYVQVRRDPVVFPSGAYGTYLTLKEAKTLDGFAGVVIVPITQAGELCFIRQFRFPTRCWSLEFPRGGGAKDETSEELARREVQEEIGAATFSVNYIGKVQSNNGFSDSWVAVYLARLSGRLNEQSAETTEALGKVEILSQKEVFGLIASSEISDTFSLAAFLLAMSRGEIS